METHNGAIRVKIGSMSYQITADGDPTYLREIARKADDLIQSILKNNNRVNSAQAIVLALLNALDAVERSKGDGLLAQETRVELNRQLAESKAELMRIREQAWEQKKDLLYYRNLCELYEERLEELNNLTQRSKRSLKSKAPQLETKRPLDKRQRSLEEVQNQTQTVAGGDSTGS